MELSCPVQKLLIPLAIYHCTIYSLAGQVRSQDVDLQYEACREPASCGDGQNISYPFWIPSQPSYCGYPGFNLTCERNQTVLRTVLGDFIVLKIDYENQFLKIVNQSLGGEICQDNIHTILSRSSFSVWPNQPSLLFDSICANKGRERYHYHRVNCSTNRILLVYDKDDQSNSNNYFRFCKSELAVPVLEESVAKGNLSNPWELLSKGFLLQWNVTSCIDCKRSGGVCGYDYDESRFMCMCHDRPYITECGSKSSSPLLIILAASGGIAIFIVAFLAVIICPIFALESLWKVGKRVFYWKKNKDSSCNVEAFLQTYGTLVPKRYEYNEIKMMTNFFKQKIGEGGYGSVFKGKLPNGLEVAVKLLTQSKGNGEEFVNEVASIGRTYHVNIVTLLGFCSEGSKRALVYEFMPNGSLEKFIFSRRRQNADLLGWEKLLEILIGIARGLDYLHRGCNMRILHFDIKPHNILLDHDFCPKISDFGLAKLCPSKDSIISMLDTRGTIGYIAPELFCRNLGGVSYKSDVYSYGMLVLEMAGGRHNLDAHIDKSSQIYFPQWVYSRIELDQDLGIQDVVTNEEDRIARKMIKVGLWCIQTEPPKRPSMSKVVEMLEGDIDSIEMPPKPFLSSPTSAPQESSTSSVSSS